MAATTPIITNTGTYIANVTVPINVIPNNFSLMRIVLSETSDTSTIKACGNYAKGETQDYRVQFLTSTIDAGITAIINPTTNGTCNGSANITLTLKNFGSAPISNIPITVIIKGPDNTLTTINEVYSSLLAPFDQTNFTLTGTFNAQAGATYSITALTNLSSDPISANNQLSSTATILTAVEPDALSATLCDDVNKYLLTGSGDGELLWYQHSNDVVPIAFGYNTATTKPPVNGTYYAGLNDLNTIVGPANKSTFSGGGYNQFTPSINITTEVPIILQSARLYVGNSGTIIFNVANANGQVVATTTINAIATCTNPQPGAQVDDPNDKGQVYNLNLILPTAGRYTVTAVYDNAATLYRSNGGVTGYPFKVGNIFSITGNTATSTTDSAYYKGFYYYLYNLQIKSAGCASVVRKAVVVSKPVITQTGNLLKSDYPIGNQWFLNDVAIPGAVGQTYNPMQSGNYVVKRAILSSCIVASDNFAYAQIAVNPGNNDIGLTAFPIPANNSLNVLFNAKSSGPTVITLSNSSGKKVLSQTQNTPSGNFSIILNVGNLPSGVYILSVLTNNKTYSDKIVLVH